MAFILAALILTAVPSATRLDFIALTPENINGLQMKNPQGLAVNPRNEEFLVTDALNDRIIIFDTTGSPVFDFSLGEDRHNPFGIAVDSSEEIIVGAMDEPVLWFFDYGGRYIDAIELPNNILPGRFIITPEDNILLIDRAGKEGVLLNHSGTVMARYKSKDTEGKPSDLCLDKRGDIVMISSAGDVVTAFDPAGQVRYTLGSHGRKPGDFSFPTSAAIDDQGSLWVVDSFRHELKHFDSDRKFLGIVGGRGTGQGELFFPADIKITPGGKMGVLEKGSGRLQIFRMIYGK